MLIIIGIAILVFLIYLVVREGDRPVENAYVKGHIDAAQSQPGGSTMVESSAEINLQAFYQIVAYELGTNPEFKVKMRGLMREWGMEAEPSFEVIVALQMLTMDPAKRRELMPDEALDDEEEGDDDDTPLFDPDKVDSPQWLLRIMHFVACSVGYEAWVEMKTEFPKKLATDTQVMANALATMKQWNIEGEPTAEKMFYATLLKGEQLQTTLKGKA